MVHKLQVTWQINRHLLVILFIFFVVNFLLVWNGGRYQIFESPDANSNFYFSQRISQGRAPIFPAITSKVSEFVTPRSALVRGESIVPAGFWGLILLYGSLGYLFGTITIPYWTIAFAILGLVFFYLLISKIFNPKVALWSTALAAFHPAWWYYTNRSLLPNVLFISLLLPSIYYWYLTSLRTRRLDFFLAGLFLAAAVVVRPSEIVWIGALLIIYLVSQRQLFLWSKICWALLGIIPVAALYLFLVPTIDTSGYISIVAQGKNIWQTVVSLIFPFGFHPRLIFLVAENYWLRLFLPFTVLTIVGTFIFSTFFSDRRQRYYVMSWLGVSFFLLLYYGSWLLNDNPNPTLATIGTSYVRYFLPIYLFSCPLIVCAIEYFVRDFLPKQCRLWRIFLYVTLLIFSVKVVIFDAQEGIWQQRLNLQVYERTRQRVEQVVSVNDVIMTARSDKYLWPAYYTLTPQGDDHYLDAGAVLLQEGRKLYYLNPTLDSAKINSLNQNWSAHGIQIGPEVFSAEGLTLYTISAI